MTSVQFPGGSGQPRSYPAGFRKQVVRPTAPPWRKLAGHHDLQLEKKGIECLAVVKSWLRLSNSIPHFRRKSEAKLQHLRSAYATHRFHPQANRYLEDAQKSPGVPVMSSLSSKASDSSSSAPGKPTNPWQLSHGANGQRPRLSIVKLRSGGDHLGLFRHAGLQRVCSTDLQRQPQIVGGKAAEIVKLGLDKS
jgi:hypothetical protein